MDNPAVAMPASRPYFGFLHHLSLPCRNLDESKRFYIEVLGGELYHDTPGFAEVKIADIIIGLSEQAGGWTGHEDEYPHYGLNVDAANFALGKSWFDACGVPNYGWTRNFKTALRYFRDPSGNLLELYCVTGFTSVNELELGPRQGGQPLPLGALNYRWDGKIGDFSLERPRIESFGHLSMPVRDIEQSKRFYIEVMGGEPMVTSDPETFTEVRVAGAVVGLSSRGGAWTGRESEFPHYAFHADADNFMPIIEWLKAQGVVTPGPWTRDGTKGLMYFRDPSGNLLEIYCGRDLAMAKNFPRGAKQDGTYITDYAGLFYDWPK